MGESRDGECREWRHFIIFCLSDDRFIMKNQIKDAFRGVVQ
uniref:Uncharacterized protein n=1 Tax=uncultured Desulfobacterium sp. TaxID=201089 RepID=E1YBU3_9BACT|nr:unknown protein [uncultured Desulfobacterium sp.]